MELKQCIPDLNGHIIILEEAIKLIHTLLSGVQHLEFLSCEAGQLEGTNRRVKASLSICKKILERQAMVTPNEYPIELCGRTVNGILSGAATVLYKPLAGHRHLIKAKTGDMLWVKEIWSANLSSCKDLRYKATDTTPYSWFLADCMPRWASRLTLEVADICEIKLQDIDEDDARNAGFSVTHNYHTTNKRKRTTSARDNFAKFWDLENCVVNQAWSDNPIVCKITFRRVEV